MSEPAAEERGGRLAGLLCLFGFFLHMVLSDPLLTSFGFNYSGDEGKFYEKIHPGTPFIYLSLMVLLWRRGNPFSAFLSLCHRQKAAIALLILTVVLFFYMVARDGISGLAFILDTHMTVPIAAIVLAYTPARYARAAVLFFVAVAALNSLIGIAESLGQFRIFSFAPDWPVLKEEHFRSSALRGHPLNNTMLTAVALFVVLGLPMRLPLKLGLAALMLASLVPFGGRIGLAFSVVAVMGLGAVAVTRQLHARRLTMFQGLLLAGGALLAPCLLLGGIYALLQSDLGARITSHGIWDESASSRTFALMVFDFMTPEEILLGISAERITEISYRINLQVAMAYIENPWLMMLMYLGAVGFTLWLASTLAFLRSLARHKNVALKLAIVAYFVIASTSNSFGRKDSTYLIMVVAVACAGYLQPARARRDAFPLRAAVVA